jgi:hypothetical protein
MEVVEVEAAVVPEVQVDKVVEVFTPLVGQELMAHSMHVVELTIIMPIIINPLMRGITTGMVSKFLPVQAIRKHLVSTHICPKAPSKSRQVIRHSERNRRGRQFNGLITPQHTTILPEVLEALEVAAVPVDVELEVMAV